MNHVVVFDGTSHLVIYIEDLDEYLKNGCEYIQSFYDSDDAFDYADSLNKS